jgi:hypothetical protein
VTTRVIKVTVDVAEIERRLKVVPKELHARIPSALNIAGYRMEAHAVRLMVMQEFRGQVPEPAVYEGLWPSRATDLDHTFTLDSDQSLFPYHRWITRDDEKVCQICEPRHNRIYSSLELEALFPAHPNCRCIVPPEPLGDALIRVAPQVTSKAVRDAVDYMVQGFLEFWP